MLEASREWVKILNQTTRKSDYYATLTSKKYRHLKGFVEYDQVMFDIARTRCAYDFYDIETLKEDFIHRTSLLSINDLIVDGFHSFWLAPNLFNAFLQTDIPQKLHSLHRVIKNGVLFLPEGLYSPDGSSVRWLMFNHRLTTDTFPPVKLRDTPLYAVKNDMDCLAITFYDSQRFQYSTNRPLYLVNGDLSTKYDNEKFILNVRGDTDEDLEKQFMDKIFTLVVNTIIFLQTYEQKELTEYLSQNKKQKVKTKKIEKLEPYLIGEKYVTKKKFEKREGCGIGAKKSQHWRRGHYRNQICGSREKPEHKLIWIEPVLINAVD